MQSTYFDHPTEEALERFLLHQSRDEELEVLESHILACESCVTRLEDLEVWLAATKLALNEILAQKSVKATANERPSWRRSWFTVRNFSLAGTVAALALGIVIIPHDRSVKWRLQSTVLPKEGCPLLPRALSE
jgi:hypothetical protein